MHLPKSCSILFSAFALLPGIETANANVIVESRDEQPQNSALTNLNENLELAAKGFMLVQHGSETMTVEGMWAGTIFAPTADLILGQSNKTLYGRFLGKNVTVHQYATIYSTHFNPETSTEFVWREK